MSIKLLTEYHLEFLSLTGGCTGSPESAHVKMPHCWKSHVTAHLNSVTEPHTSSSLSSLIGSSDFDERIRNIMEDVYADMPKTVSFKSSYHQVLILYSLIFLKNGMQNILFYLNALI